MEPKLNPRQTLFVEEYLKDLNATQAAIRAGYSKESAHAIGPENLEKPAIKAAIKAAIDRRAEAVQIDAQYVLNGITKLIDRCEQAVPVFNKDGEETGEYTFQGSVAMKGYELLGRHFAMFSDKLQMTGKDGGPIEISEGQRATRISVLFKQARERADSEEKHNADDLL
jgi:phage terminase small subunit